MCMLKGREMLKETIREEEGKEEEEKTKSRKKCKKVKVNVKVDGQDIMRRM